MRYLYLAIANLVFVLVIVLASHSQEPNWVYSNRAPLGTFLLLQGTDAYFTERDQNYLWHVERNPLISHSTAGRAGYFAGTGAAVVLASWWMDHRGHRKLSKAILWLGAGVEAQATARSWGKF